MGKVWAIARNLIMEVLRMRPLMILLTLMIGVSTLGFGYWLHASTGPIDEKVQTFISYSLTLAMTILSFLTIFISIATITRDIKRKEVFTVTTKPISRGQFLLGKLCGMIVLNLVFLGLFGALIYGIARNMSRFEDASEGQIRRLNELVLIARKSVKPPFPDFRDQAYAEADEMVAEEVRTRGIIDARGVEVMRTAAIQNRLEALTRERIASVAPGGQKVWHFSGIDPIDQEEGRVYVRYKLDVSYTPTDLHVYGDWLYGPQDPSIAGGTRRPSRDPVRTVREFSVQPTDISPEGDLFVGFRNPVENSPATIIFPPETGIEVLYVVDSFEGNFFRGLLLILLRLIFLSVLGLAIGAWLGFPVALLCVLIVFILAVASGFVGDAIQWEAGPVQKIIYEGVTAFIPRFAEYDPVPHLERGKLVSWPLLGQCTLYMMMFRAGILAAFGYVIFRFRELARVIV